MRTTVALQEMVLPALLIKLGLVHNIIENHLGAGEGSGEQL